jgi:hypothetical protein
MAELNAINDYAGVPRATNSSETRNVTSIAEMQRDQVDHEARNDALKDALLWFEQTKVVLSRSCELGHKRFERLVRQINDSVRRAADERPLQVVAIVAGSAFIAGAILRVWRSNAHN